MNISANITTLHHSAKGTKLRLWPGLVLMLLFSLTLIPAAQAQVQVNELATLEVELWPDYDRSAVLVLLTGTLADDAPVPATLVLPMPDEATVNAVAHFDVATGEFQNISDPDTTLSGQIRLTTPSPTFRVEYYVPYTLDGDRRDFTFDWRSDMAIEQLLATVQQPAEASDFELSPASDQPADGQDGLTYHRLAVRALPAGQTFAISGSYNLSSDLLTFDVLSTRQPAVEGPLPLVGDVLSTRQSAVEGPLPLVSDTAQDSSSGLDWPVVAIVAGGLIFIAALVWFLYTNNQASRQRRPRPRPVRQAPSRPKSPPSSSAAAQYCHNCGRPVDAEDRFCRECGTAVKGR